MIRHSVKNAGRCHTIKHQTNAQVIIMAKKTKCFADGGAIGSDGLTDEQRAKKNAALSSLGISSAPAPVPQPQAQNPAPPPKPQQQGIGSGIIGILKGRQQQIDKAAGYANGGIINDELLYAGLNGRGETERNMEWETRHLSPEAKAQYFIERDKVALEASKVRNGYANGGIIRGPGTAKSDSIPATVRETGEEIRVGNGERIVSKEQDAALGHIAQMLGYESVDAMFEKLTGKPVGPTIKGGKRAARYGANGEWIPDEIPKETNLSPLAGQTQAAVTPIAANQGRGVMDTPIGASFEKSIANFKAGVPQGSEITARPDVSAQQAASATGAQQTNPLVSGIQNTSPFVVAKERFPISVEGGQFITGSKPGEMPSSAQGGFTQDGKSYNVNQTSQPGISRVTASGTSPLYTNINPEMAVNQLAGMKSGQMRIGDGGFNLAEQNERMAKSLGYAGVDGFNKAMRGIETAKLAGNPLEQQIKQLELKKQGIISGLFDKASSGDQDALAKYNALVNGSKEPNYSNRYITLPNRKTYNDMGQITGEEPGGVFDAKTGQLANFGKQGTGVNIEEANKIKAAVASGAMKREDAIKKLQAMGLQ